jgi:hypothetical protein
VKALGGHTKVRACKSCNDTIGSEVEGGMQRPDALLNLAKQVQEGSGSAIRGTVGSEELEVEHNLATGELRILKPVSTETRDGEKVFRVKGSPRQVRQILTSMGIPPEDIDKILACSRCVDLSNEWFETIVTHCPSLAVRLGAKVALGASVVAAGDEFHQSGLMDNLRRILIGEEEPAEYLQPAALHSVDDLLQTRLPPGSGLDPIGVKNQEGQSHSQVVFMALGNAQLRTAIFIHLMGHDITLGGMVVEGGFPGNNLPIVVRDRPGSPLVRRLDEEIATALSKSLPPTAADLASRWLTG